MQRACQKRLDGCQRLHTLRTAAAKEHEVVHIAAVVLRAQGALDEVVQRVEVDQRVKLAEQVADRDAHNGAVVGKLHHHAHKAGVFHFALYQGLQNAAVDAVEEFAHVKLQQVALGVAGAQCGLCVVGGGMGAFGYPAGKALVDKAGVEQRVDQAVNGVLHHQVAERGGVNDALLGFVHREFCVGLRAVIACVQFAVQCVKVGAKIAGKFKGGALVVFALAGIYPGLV